MHFVRSGQGRPTLLFVHGLGGRHEDWDGQREAFESDHEVVACDLRGHGATPGRPDECSIEHCGGDVAALLSHLGLSGAILIGHSLGCRVVLEAARLDPERVGGLVLIDGSRQAMGDGDAAEEDARAMLRARGYEAFMRPFFEAMFLERSARSEAVVARALRLPPVIGTAFFCSMARWDASRMEAALDAVRAPVLVIQCTYVNTERQRVPLHPGETTPWLDLLRQKISALTEESLPGVGHFPQLEVPDRVEALIARFARTLRSS